MTRNSVMLHHSLTSDSKTVSWGAIRRYHKDTNHWLDIGYHYGVELVNDQYEVLVGRPETWLAAACREGGMNEHAIHICCVGNYDDEPPPRDLLDVLVSRILLPVMRRYKISPDAIVGHRDFASYKTCPGTKFNLDIVRSATWAQLS